MSKAVGMVELSSIAAGYEAQDAMLKASSVELLVARTICSGKYVVIVGGDVSDVHSSVNAGCAAGKDYMIESLVLPNAHESLFPAIANTTVIMPEDKDALGVVETFTVSAIIEAGDAAAKAAEVKLFRIHVAMAIGGKGFLLVTGDVASTRAAVNAAAEVGKARGVLAHYAVIPRPEEELFGEMV